MTSSPPFASSSWLVCSFKQVIRSSLALLISLVLLQLFAAARDHQTSNVEFKNRPAPPVVFENLDGSLWKLTNQRGKVVVIDFWGPSCGACRRAMASLKAMQAKYGNRQDFVLVGATRAEHRRAVAEYCLEKNLSWPQLLVPVDKPRHGVHPDALAHSAIPSIWIIDRQGRVVGADLSADAAVETVAGLMKRNQ